MKTEGKSVFDNYLTERLNYENLDSKRSAKKKWLNENYLQLLPSSKKSSILEIGPGYGEFIEWLALDLGYSNVSAVDISSEVVDFCNQIVPGKTTLAKDTTQFISSLVIQNKAFDMVCMFQVLEHIPKPDSIELLSNIRQSLTSKGRVVIEVPNMANPLLGMSMRYDDFTHEVGFTAASLEHLLRSCGFSQISVHELLPPRDSILRLCQRGIQSTINIILQLMIKAYLPSDSKILSPSIYAIAKI
jgi:2-polyprenyl-3-methyl-5-hydroxy-6-metoxy-1,4-benzoquinol methylase